MTLLWETKITDASLPTYLETFWNNYSVFGAIHNITTFKRPWLELVFVSMTSNRFCFYQINLIITCVTFHISEIDGELCGWSIVLDSAAPNPQTKVVCLSRLCHNFYDKCSDEIHSLAQLVSTFCFRKSHAPSTESNRLHFPCTTIRKHFHFESYFLRIDTMLS